MLIHLLLSSPCPRPPLQVSPALLGRAWLVLEGAVGYFDSHVAPPLRPPQAMKLWLDVYLQRHELRGDLGGASEADGRQISKGLLDCLRQVIYVYVYVYICAAFPLILSSLSM